MSKYCPVLSDVYYPYCIESGCKWYVEEENKCVLHVIADRLKVK